MPEYIDPIVQKFGFKFFKSWMFTKSAFIWSKIQWRQKYYVTLLQFTFTFSHLADAFIQSDLELGNTSSD